jgi:hypothetical protein
MKCVVCTLFEHHYHYGVAVLVNSLIRWGFKGDFYAGFRGPLPPWAESGAKRLPNGHIELRANPDVRVIFIPLETTAHLTNYKPDFMLQIEALATANSDALIYVDPDITLDIEWQFIEDWLTCGVAVCEDVNSPVPENHPHRVGWRRFFKPHGFELKFRTNSYANGGFVGLTWNYRKILPMWQEFMTHIGELLGGKNVVGIAGGVSLQKFYGFANCFAKTDQDALNALVEAAADVPFSFLGRDAMGFQGGKSVMPHALGNSKPWNRNYLRRSFDGLSPSRGDRHYWTHAEGPLRPFSAAHIASTRRRISIASAIARFNKRA